MTAGGKNVAPAVLEDRLRAHPLVDQCLVVGDGQPFIGALVTLDPDALPLWAEPHDRAGRPRRPGRRPRPPGAEIQAAVDDANKAVSKAESIRKFAILPVEWTEEGGQLTPSLKLKRNVVHPRASATRSPPSTSRDLPDAPGLTLLGPTLPGRRSWPDAPGPTLLARPGPGRPTRRGGAPQGARDLR